MIDEGAVIRDALLTRTALATLVAATPEPRLWPDTALPADGYKPAQGIGIGFRTRGGGQLYNRALIYPSVQFIIWGIDKTTARLGYRTLVDVLDDKSFDKIRRADLEQPGQPGTQAGTGWPFVLCFFTIWLVR